MQAVYTLSVQVAVESLPLTSQVTSFPDLAPARKNYSTRIMKQKQIILTMKIDLSLLL